MRRKEMETDKYYRQHPNNADHAEMMMLIDMYHPVRIWHDGNVNWIFARSAEQARQWGIKECGIDEAMVPPAEKWKALDNNEVITLGYEDLEDLLPLPEGGELLPGRGRSRAGVKATVQAWIDQHMEKNGALPWVFSSDEA